jgi:hypothetical protein
MDKDRAAELTGQVAADPVRDGSVVTDLGEPRHERR